MATLAGWLAGKVGYDSLQAITHWGGPEHPVGQWKPQPTGPTGGGGAEHPVGQSIANPNHGRGGGGGSCGPDTYMFDIFSKIYGPFSYKILTRHDTE